jgi:drug/metabolite transporter (DMT)-like permease
MRNAVVIGFLAAFSTAAYRSLDNFTVHSLITAPDNLTAAFAYLIVGAWTGVVTGLGFSLLLRKKLIDPEFTTLKIRNSRMHLQAFISGVISAVSMLFLLLGNQLGDPSVLISLANLTIIYTLFYDAWKNQINLKQLLLPTIITVLGGMMTTFNSSLSITALGLFYVLIISNGLNAVSNISQQQGVRCSDAVSFFIWRFFWLAMIGTILAIFVSALRGYYPLLLETIKIGLTHLAWIILTMFFVFLGMGLQLFLQKTQAISVVLLIFSTQLLFAYPITFLGNALKPGAFGDLPENAAIWFVRVIGAALVIFGVSKLQRRQLLEKV